MIVEDATIHEDLIRDESFDSDVTSLLDWCVLSGGRVFQMRDLPEQNGLRILEIGALRESLDTSRSDVAQSIRDLPEQNWMRIMEIAALKQDVTSLRSEVDQLKQLLLNEDIHRRATA